MIIGKGIVILVTGGASGLGEASVRRLHKLGATLVVVDQDKKNLELLKTELGVLTIFCDVTIEQQVKEAIDKTIEAYGMLHAVIASAGVGWVTPTIHPLTGEGIDTKVFSRVVSINLLGSVFFAKYAAIAMAKNSAKEKGVIIFVSSVNAEEAQKGLSAYGATKAALSAMVLPMARDLGKFGIRVLAIAPGPFETSMTSNVQPEMRVRLNQDTPQGRWGQPDEFAHMAQVCIENGYLNGVSLRLDGATKISLAHPPKL